VLEHARDMVSYQQYHGLYSAEDEGCFLEGTGVCWIVLMRKHIVVYPPRADEELLIEFCEEDFGYTSTLPHISNGRR
jgi:hypothetical protein